jgi:hypothetical protein
MIGFAIGALAAIPLACHPVSRSTNKRRDGACSAASALLALCATATCALGSVVSPRSPCCLCDGRAATAALELRVYRKQKATDS